jgi:hypothetical protein
MKLLVVGVALATLVASPAFAQSYVHQGGRSAFARVAPGPAPFQSPYAAYGAVSPFGSPSVGRAAAIHQCSGAAARYNEYTWGDMEIQQYRACMAQHGQVE